MTTLFELSHAVHEHPSQADFWRREIAATREPTALARDYVAGTANARFVTAEAGLEASAVSRLSLSTRDNPVLVTVFHAAVLGVVAARATDTSVVSLAAGTSGHACALALHIDGQSTFRELLSQARTTYLQAAAHADVPVDFLFSQAGRTPGDIAVAVDSHEADLFGSTLRFEVRDARVRVTYRADLFTAETADRLTQAFARVLTRVTSDVDTPLWTLLAADENELSLIGKFNDSTAGFPIGTPLHAFLERQAAEFPDRVAVLDDNTAYGELNRRANQLARKLRALGVARGDVVAVCMPRSVAELIAIYAVLKAGAAYLPIDPSVPSSRFEFVLEQSGASVVLGDHAEVTAGVRFVDVTDPANFTGDTTDLQVETGPDDLCYVIYTSGSSGRPKGVMIEHRAIVNRLAWMQRAYPLSRDDVLIHKTPFTFDVSVWEIFWWSLAGAAVCTLASGDERDPERIAARIKQCAVTTVHFVPSMLQPFLRFTESTGATKRLASLRTVFSSGEELRASQAGLFAAVLGGSRLINLYGPTEAAVDVTHFDCADLESRRAVPIGRPIDNIRLSVMTRAGQIAPIGTPGELCIAGVGVARGYLGSPRLTASGFRPDSSGDRVYRTGDCARWLPDGTIEYLGRLDRQVKIHGYRIEPAEIEHAAVQAKGVAECAVVVVPDDQLCAYVVPGRDFREDDLRATLSARLPAYMLPSLIVTVDHIPATANGKRDLAALPKPTRDNGSAYIAPRTDTERRLAAIWGQVLGIERVGRADNFFEVGGDSIKFIGVLAAAHTQHIRFSFQDLFAHPTIAELTAHVSAATPEPGSHEHGPFELLDPSDRQRLPADAQDAYPMSTLQIGLLYETARTEGLYHDVVSYLVPDQLELDTFAKAVQSVAQRHAIFRTSFHPTGFTEPIQVAHDTVSIPLETVDLSGLPQGEQDERLGEFHRLELATGFQAGAVDLVRVRLHLLGERGLFYSLSYHAAALDGWSVSTVHRDIFATYFALREGTQPEIAGYEHSYAQFVQLERQAISAPAQREFWLRLLDDAVGTRLPGSRAAGPVTVRMHNVPMPDGLSGQVIRTAANLGVPVKSVLLAAHVAVLSFVAGTDDVLTGYEHSGRPEVAGSQQLPGLFLNTIPLRVRVGRESWAELVRRVFDAEAELLPYRRYPLAEVMRQTGARAALFETVFNFTHFHVLKDLVAGHGFELTRCAVVSQTGFPFRAEFWQDAITDDVGLALHYHEQAYAAEQIERIAGYYIRALELLTTRTQEDHRATTLLGEAELSLLTQEFAGPARELPDGTLVDLFAEQVRQRPDAIAVSEGDSRLDYRTLDAQSDRVAALLESSGVQHGDVVAVPMERGLAWAVSVLAIFKLGAVYLPQDPADPPERRAATLRRCQCRHVLTTAKYEEARHAPAKPAAARSPQPDSLAYIIFTSGSTGEPKGASINHRGMLNHLMAKVDDLGLGDGDRVAHVATQCFDISVWQLVAAWLVGGQTVIVPAEVVTDLPSMLDTLQDEQVTILEVVPSYLDALLFEVESRTRPLPSLRYNLVTGEAFPPALAARWFARYDAPLVNAYGPTEASDDVTHHFLTGPVEGDRVPVGRPIINTRLYVVGPEDRLMPIGSYGEVCVTGVGVGPGYVNDPAATAAVFQRNDVDDTSPTLYRTGDIGRWLPGGVLDCAGRRDHQVKIRGFRIELTEIESALARLPGVEHAVAIVRQKQIAAFYTGEATVEVRAALADWLPDYMLPDSVLKLDSFPLTRNGKVDRSALARMDRAAAVEVVRDAPADSLEAEVLEVFTEILGAPVGVLDNFFDAGGHSLAAIKVIAKLDSRITLRDLLAGPTARSLAQRLREGRPEPHGLLVDLTEVAGHVDDQDAVTVVCVPFAGGRAVSYLPLARALDAARVLGVELPAGVPAEQVAAKLAAATQGEVVLLGHSTGTAIALLAALELQRAGRPAVHLVILSHLLDTVDSVATGDDEVMHWLETTGLVEVQQFSPAERADIAAAFRHDSAEARRVLAGMLRSPEQHKITCPATVVLAADDPVTSGREEAAEPWGALAPDLRVVIADSGGHYLNSTRPGLLAEILGRIR